MGTWPGNNVSRASAGRLMVLAISLFALSCSSEDTPLDTTPPPPCCDVTSFVPDVALGGETGVMVPMRDCIRLATDIYLPDGAGPFPAILIRLPYNKETGVEDLPAMKLAGIIFSAKGYATVIQDTRGRYASEGVFVPFIYEQSDGIDTVRWIEAQPWFDGNLGMFGGSYFGFTQIAVAHQRPASLKAMIPLVTPSIVYSMLYYSGLPRPDIVINWGLDMYEQGSMEGDTFQKAALHWPLKEADDVSVGDVPWFDEWLAHPFNDEFYARSLPLDAMERIDTPMLMLSGWFDPFADVQLRDFEAAQATETEPGTTRIIVGPWTHDMGFFEHHDLYFADARNLLSFLDLMIEWFGHFLKGEALSDWGPVRIYNPGTQQWTDRPTLWSPGREEYALYLSGDQGAASCQPVGGLSSIPVSQPAQIRYTYDPLDPIITWGGPLLDMPNGCLVQEGHCDRGDVITLESPPFAHEVTIDGKISLELRASSTAPDTAFVGRLSLVREEGIAYFLRQGVITLSHRNGDLAQAAYVPLDVVDARIDMPPLLWTLHPGERLRLEISSSSFPSVGQHPNVDRNWFSVTDPRPAAQTLHLDPDRPARLILHISPPPADL